MGQSYRIKATPGKDQNIVVPIEQDFEQLEILSLKIKQSEIYLKMCSEVGIVAGRVFSNNGYGIPNAKLSIFIPVTNQDLQNPTIESIYPYKNLVDTNEDGYKYNLLPYLPSYDGHVPTGTFPSRLDNLVNQTVVQLYDKYYKYTVQTNDSGDYMIYGVPLGTQTLVMNLDLSDMGPFSLGPQDLIRMGRATEEQLDGVKFKSSTNFAELPQIVVINKTVDVIPFWGEEEVCQIGITRSDFDLTSELGIDIQPTAIFMGSLMSSSERTALKPTGPQTIVGQLGGPRKVTGKLCNMIAGPGEIIALRQTIFFDSAGLPIIERADLENGGKVIDGDGAWMLDLPMNLDYVYTDEYGNQKISNDPKVGIPTKAKYRFKIKWQQSKNLSVDYKRGYYLVPNIREKGWVPGGLDPKELFGTTRYQKFQSSYAFSYDWSAYTWDVGNVTITNPDISDAINCVDTFYEFHYNKVYTVSMFMDNFRVANNRQRFLAIKNIDDDACDDTVNRYPVNDAYFNAGILWRVLNILIIILSYVMLPLLFVYHIVAFIWNVIITKLWTLISLGIGKPLDKMKGFSLPMITYPDCDACDCGANINYEGGIASCSEACYDYSWTSSINFSVLGIPLYVDYIDCSGTTNTISFGGDSGIIPCCKFPPRVSNVYGSSQSTIENAVKFTPDNCCGASSGSNTTLYPANSQIDLGQTFPLFNDSNYYETNYGPIFANTGDSDVLAGYGIPPAYGIPISNIPGSLLNPPNYYSEDLPLAERINLFNVKSKYYGANGVNQIKVSYQPSTVKYHFDNVLIFITKRSTTISAGKMFTFVDINTSSDINVTSGPTNSLGTNNISGTTTYPTSVNISYADPNNRNTNIIQNYTLPNISPLNSSLYIYPSDVEYFQVITGLTITDFVNLSTSGGFSQESFSRILRSDIRINRTFGAGSSYTYDILDIIDNDSIIVICQRGVDPYSPKYSTKVGLGRLFGFSSHDDIEVTLPLRLNIPIQNGNDPQTRICYQHNTIDNNTPQYGLNLFYPSYCFTPDSTQYTPYNTTKLNYYSELDFDLNYAPSTYFLQDPLITNRGNYNSSLEVWGQSSNRLYNSIGFDDKKYCQYESIVGGSYMYFDFDNVGPGIYFRAFYYSKIYDNTNSINMTNSTNIIVRSDRLPSGDSFPNIPGLTLLLQQNTDIKIYQQDYYLVNSTVIVTGTGSTGVDVSIGGTPAENQGDNDGTSLSNVLDTFSCENLVQIGCYRDQGLTFSVDPSCAADIDTNRIKNGCYLFMVNYKFNLIDLTGPIFDFFRWDIKNYFEYFYRLRVNFALCQDIFGTMFHNNWINGNLYAFPIKINNYYNSLNKIYKREYPDKVVVLHDDTNNFYYRSSPYDDTSGKFIGVYNFSRPKGANERNIRYPTTIIDLGPKYAFLKQLVLNKTFNGYNINKIDSTSYNDLSDIINFFVISRITNPSFGTIAFGTGKGSFMNFYSRPAYNTNLKYYIDGDAAQAMAINSQIGVIAFDNSYYSTSALPGLNPQIITPGAGPSNIVMGIFFSSSFDDIQIRDYISPMRTIVGQNAALVWKYETIPHNSQEVPNYRWNIVNGYTIFGTQLNDWDYSLISGELYTQKYQELDRITDLYVSPTPVPITDEINYRGYLSDKDNNPFATLNINPGIVGAPWYFYFGLNKGKTAINLFYTKYIGEINLNE